MTTTRRSPPILIFAGLACALVVIMAFVTVRNVRRERDLIRQSTLTQGYWIARSLEVSHRMVPHDDVTAMRNALREIGNDPAIRFMMVLDYRQQVLVASDATREGTRWPGMLQQPAEQGRIIDHVGDDIVLAFPAFFARASQSIPPEPHDQPALDHATWIILGLDVSSLQAHYRITVVQSVVVAITVVMLGLGAFVIFGAIQRYRLASASLEHLEQIKRHLARFVPNTVQKLIEENPERPLLDKVEREATILFLDIEHYTVMAAELPPDALNRLMETYFSTFLDAILSHGGDINETSGDGMMAIFTGKTPCTHALNAVKAALAIRKRAVALNQEKGPHEPELRVNMGINTGQVLLGATMMKGAVGERLTYTASGMVTNIAARLCEYGSTGEIYLSATTAHLVRSRVALHGPHEARLRHVQELVSVYKLHQDVEKEGTWHDVSGQVACLEPGTCSGAASGEGA